MSNSIRFSLLTLSFIATAFFAFLFNNAEDALLYSIVSFFFHYVLAFFVYETDEQKYRRTTRRVAMHIVRYCEADEYIKEGWILAFPEEDNNHTNGIVFLEKRVGK